MHPGEIWFGKSFGARLARLALLPLSGLYWVGWQTYLALYKIGFKKAKEPHKPVIVVGNLTAGGSGKTPVTLEVARALRAMGKEVVIGCSGYGSPHAEHCAFAPEGPLNPEEWGDEPAMIRWFLPDLPLIVGRARVDAAILAHERHPGAVLLMDDGFQHLPLKKHLAILIEPSDPQNSFCLPAGPYREPRSNHSRADLVLSEKPTAGAQSEFHIVRSPLLYESPEGERQRPPKATALCAIGRPERFFAEIRQTVDLVEPVALPDHDPLARSDLFTSLPQGLPVIVTAKDWVKLRRRPDVGSREFVIARQVVSVEPSGSFRDWLRRRLEVNV
jgi:tetraacyldisaccharide 4'-kinase